ncbi:nonsense-mediated mRNA decay factor SMG7-like [Watersipora subatra]|uniref:nonsense-mediated mRNA decay factor SMG7-like n=1 Tax=Watersipora subatra TaxID=2589382 RepID=UPI00355B9DC0
MIGSTEETFRNVADIKAHLSSMSSSESDSKDEPFDQLLKPDAMLLRQRLQTLCRTLLLTSLEAALDQKIETELWNFAFKAQISALQQLIKAKSSSTKRTELQADFHLFLESSLGFYMQLLEDICEAFHLHPHFRRKYSSFGIIQGRREQNKRAQARLPSKTSCMYICQYCLVHLGDIARYLQRIALAENFYNLASRYVPSNGQPYNQLAILCSTRSNKLAVTYYYIRSIAVRSPFPVAPTNLEKLYSKQIKDCESVNFVSKNKWTHGEVVMAFLYLQALIHLETDKEKTSKLVELLHKCLSSQTIFSLLSAQNMTHMVAISLFTLSHIDSSGSEKALTDDEVHFRDVTVSFLAGFLEVLLNQAQKYNVREHIALPTIKIILDWLICREGYLSNGIVKTHRCWLNLAKALNSIQSHCKDSKSLDLSVYDRLPLPEDVELQCFLPLHESHESLDFSLIRTQEWEPDDVTRVRCRRLVELGKVFSERYPSLNLIDYKVNAKNTKMIFSASSAIKVERRRAPNNRNVAIQALKSQETSSSTVTNATTEATQEDLPPWLLGGPLGLTSASDLSFPSGFEKVSSYSSFQSDITSAEIRGASPSVTSFGLSTNPAEELSSRGASPAAPIGTPSQDSSLGAGNQQDAIGAELSNRSRTLAELIDATRTADPVQPPMMNFSASDSSIFLTHGSGYSLFSPSFPSAALAPEATSGEDNLPQRPAGYSIGWPTSSSQHNISRLDAHAPPPGTWGDKSALAQLLEEQQKNK